MERIKQPVEGRRQDCRRHTQQRDGVVLQPAVANASCEFAVSSPIRRQFFRIEYRGTDRLRGVDGQELVGVGNLVDADLETSE
jgi:hypothetical protein